MQSDEKCMRAILEYIDRNTGVKIDSEDNISLLSTDLYTVVKNVSEDKGIKPKEVAYNTLLCKKFGFIECRFEQNNNTLTKGKCPIFDTTSAGEKFLNANQD